MTDSTNNIFTPDTLEKPADFFLEIFKTFSDWFLNDPLHVISISTVPFYYLLAL